MNNFIAVNAATNSDFAVANFTYNYENFVVIFFLQYKIMLNFILTNEAELFQIYRKDPCEFCLCLDGEMFCWWQDCPPTLEGPCRDRSPFSPCCKFHKYSAQKEIKNFNSPFEFFKLNFPPLLFRSEWSKSERYKTNSQ